MGVDKADGRVAIHMEVPGSLEHGQQEGGSRARPARDSLPPDLFRRESCAAAPTLHGQPHRQWRCDRHLPEQVDDTGTRWERCCRLATQFLEHLESPEEWSSQATDPLKARLAATVLARQPALAGHERRAPPADTPDDREKTRSARRYRAGGRRRPASPESAPGPSYRAGRAARSGRTAGHRCWVNALLKGDAPHSYAGPTGFRPGWPRTRGRSRGHTCREGRTRRHAVRAWSCPTSWVRHVSPS